MDAKDVVRHGASFGTHEPSEALKRALRDHDPVLKLIPVRAVAPMESFVDLAFRRLLTSVLLMPNARQNSSREVSISTPYIGEYLQSRTRWLGLQEQVDSEAAADPDKPEPKGE